MSWVLTNFRLWKMGIFTDFSYETMSWSIFKTTTTIGLCQQTPFNGTDLVFFLLEMCFCQFKKFEFDGPSSELCSLWFLMWDQTSNLCPSVHTHTVSLAVYTSKAQRGTQSCWNLISCQQTCRRPSPATLLWTFVTLSTFPSVAALVKVKLASSHLELLSMREREVSQSMLL